MPQLNTLFSPDSIFWALMKNAALLVALGYVHSLLPVAKRRPTVLGQVGLGLLLGLIAITIITAAYHFENGVILDTRSILIGITGLYFGFIPTLLEVLIASSYRLWQGGAPAPIGVTVICLSGLIGLGWRHLRKPDLARISWRELLAFGYTVHLVMMLVFLNYPSRDPRLEALILFGIPILGIFPPVTVVLGKLLSSRLQRVTDAELLRQSEERFTLIFKGSNDGWWDWDLPGERLIYSPRWWEMLGRTPADHEANPNLWRELMHPGDLERVDSHLRGALESTARQYEVEFRLLHQDGTYLSVISRGYIERDASGRPVRVSGTNVDITPLRRALDEANVAKSYFESAGRIARIGYWEFSFDGSFVFWSDMTCDIHDLPPGSLVPLEEALSYYPPEYHARLRREIEEARQDGKPYHGEYEIITAKGRRIWVQSRAEPVRSADNRITGLRGVFQDIDAQVRAADALRMSERNYREIFNASTDAIFIHDESTGRVLDVNDAMLRMYGFTSKAQALELTPADLGSGEPPYGEEDAKEKILIAQTEGTHTFVWHSRHASGSLFWVEISLRRAEIGGQSRIVANVRDISERKRLEERVSEVEKMESLGRLAGGIAHDFNNMLGVIIGHADLAGYRYTADEIVQDHLTQIRHAADRSAELVRQLLTFARRQVTTPRIVDLNDSIKSTLTMLHRLIGENISLRWTPESGLWPVKIDPSQMEQILTNLVLNARDAITDHGSITLRAYNAAGRSAQDRDGVVLEVTDTGEGMSRQTLKRAFEPFFTTKSIGQGTGLGLATVYGIVEQNGGTIDVKSEPGAGTTFIVRLPRESATAPSPAGDAHELSDPSGSETILVVEDEPAMRILATRALQMKGYKVVSAASPAEGLEIASRRELAFDLVVSDIMMPGMNGHALRERILVLRPGLKFLFISGYSDGLEENLADHPMVDFLAKPFSAATLATKVRELIDRPVSTVVEGLLPMVD